MCIRQSWSPNLSLPPLPFGNHMFVFYICDYFGFVIGYNLASWPEDFTLFPVSSGQVLPLFFLTSNDDITTHLMEETAADGNPSCYRLILLSQHHLHHTFCLPWVEMNCLCPIWGYPSTLLFLYSFFLSFVHCHLLPLQWCHPVISFLWISFHLFTKSFPSAYKLSPIIKKSMLDYLIFQVLHLLKAKYVVTASPSFVPILS